MGWSRGVVVFLYLYSPQGRGEGRKLHPPHAVPLMQWHKHGDREIVRPLLRHGVDAGVKDTGGWTLLHRVAQSGGWGGLSCPASPRPWGECRSERPFNNPAAPRNVLHPQVPVSNTSTLLIKLAAEATDAQAYTCSPALLVI